MKTIIYILFATLLVSCELSEMIDTKTEPVVDSTYAIVAPVDTLFAPLTPVDTLPDTTGFYLTLEAYYAHSLDYMWLNTMQNAEKIDYPQLDIHVDWDTIKLVYTYANHIITAKYYSYEYDMEYTKNTYPPYAVTDSVKVLRFYNEAELEYVEFNVIHQSSDTLQLGKNTLLFTLKKL